MKYEIVGSGSRGNAIIIEDVLMLDCGVPFTQIRPYLKKVKIIFISHIHQDHLYPSTVKKIAYNHPLIRFICGSKDVAEKLLECGVLIQNIYFMPSRKWFSLGIVNLKLEPMKHDVDNYALKFKINNINKRGIYIVDTASLGDLKAEKYDLYLIEANYKEETLQKHLQECSQEDLIYLQRVPYTHLSYEQANTFLIDNMGANSEFQYIHESSYNFEGEE